MIALQHLTTRLALACLLLAGCTGSTDDYHALAPADLEETPTFAGFEPDLEKQPVKSQPPATSNDDSSSESEQFQTAEPINPASRSTEIVAPTPPGNGIPETTTKQPIPQLASALPGRPGMPDLTKKSAKPLEIKLLVPHREFTKEGPQHALRITFDDLDLLKVCNMEPVPPDVMEYLPDWLKSLNGQKIILRGWMFPSGRQTGISSFMFVRDNGICCFGRDPKVYDKLGVTMQPGQTTSYIAGRPFDVEGTLFIEPDIEGPDEGLWWLYRIENARVLDH